MIVLHKTKLLLDVLKNVSWWDRLFRWKKITRLLIESVAELGSTDAAIQRNVSELATLTKNHDIVTRDKQHLENRKKELESEKQEINLVLSFQREENTRLTTELAKLTGEEQARKKNHDNSLMTLQRLEERIRNERAEELQQRNDKEIERLLNLKQTWNVHESQTASSIKTIAQKLQVQYIDKVPFRGTPDNTLLICEEYIILDAKSPSGDDLKNFPGYLKDQAEKAQKYARQPDVKPSIFFVVPSNTLEILKTFVHHFPDYTVFVISLDALEPIILSLQKIEEYEFAKELTPEDRNNICRILGRFAHLSKRRIQIDSFFAKQFIELAYKTESTLPPDILETVLEFERSEKLNPPMEKKGRRQSH